MPGTHAMTTSMPSELGVWGRRKPPNGRAQAGVEGAEPSEALEIMPFLRALIGLESPKCSNYMNAKTM